MWKLQNSVCRLSIQESQVLPSFLTLLQKPKSRAEPISRMVSALEFNVRLNLPVASLPRGGGMKPGFRIAMMVPGVSFQNWSKAESKRKRSSSHLRSVNVMITNFPRLSFLELGWWDLGSDFEAIIANNTTSSSMSGPEKSGALTVLKRSGTTNVFLPVRIRVSSL